MNKVASILLFLSVTLAVAQPKLGQTLKSSSGETIETPLGFQHRETQEINKIVYQIGIDKSNKVIYIETRTPSFKVENYGFNTQLFDFKNYNYTRFFDGWGYYLRLNANWCVYFGKTKPTKTSKPLLFFNYNFGAAEGKAVFDSNYEEVLAAQVKAEKEKAEAKKAEKEAKIQRTQDYNKAQAEEAKKAEQAKKAEEARKEQLKKEAEKLKAEEEAKKKKAEQEAKKKKEEFEKQKAQQEKLKAEKAKAEEQRAANIQKELEKKKAEEEAKKKAEEERKRQYAKELAEYNAKKEAEKKTKEEEKMRKSEEFRTGQKIQNTELAQQSSSSTSSTSTEKSSGKLSGGEKLLDDLLKARIGKNLTEYLNFINKNKKHTEAYPLVLVNYKDITEYPSTELSKIKKIVSTTVFKKGHKRCDDFQEKGKNGVVIIKVEF